MSSAEADKRHSGHNEAEDLGLYFNELNEDDDYLNLLNGTYADVLFVMLPFLVICLFEIWNGRYQSIFLSRELSVAAAVIAGLAIARLLAALSADGEVMRLRGRFLLLFAAAVFGVLIPSLFVAVLINLSQPTPEYVLYIQPGLLIMAIATYTASVTARITLDVRKIYVTDENDDGPASHEHR